MKKCKKCGESKALEEFGVERRNLDGLKGSCLKCDYKYKKDYISRKYFRSKKGRERYNKMRLAISYRWREKNRWKWLEIKRNWGTKRRFDVLCFYGGVPPKCKKCGEERIWCLVIDHINNDGYQHRKSMGNKGGHDIYNWIVKNNYPTNKFQVLCHNCNWLKRREHRENKHAN